MAPDEISLTEGSTNLLDIVGKEEKIEDSGRITTAFRSCLAEFFGLVMFVFIGGMSASSGGGIVAVALAHGFTIFLLVTSLGHISGGHFNPAVTLAIAFCGGIKPLLAVAYVVFQLLGGVVGAACIKGALNNSTYESIYGGANMLNDSSATVGMGILCEMLTTCLLVSVVLGAAIDSKGHNLLASLAIGVTVGVDILSTGHISGASMNPARSLGPALVAGIELPEVWTYHYINWIGPLLGSLLAMLLYRLLFASWDKRLHPEWMTGIKNRILKRTV